MYQNDGSRTNEEVFWEVMTATYGEQVQEHLPLFEAYYRNEFQEVRKVCGYNPLAAGTVRRLKETGYRVGLATNPLFPATATKSRIRWAGLAPEDFEFYTTYENFRFCKPNLNYFTECANIMDVSPQECLMVGNDVGEDMIAEKIGMRVFLLKDCMINKTGNDSSRYPNGSFTELMRYIEE